MKAISPGAPAELAPFFSQMRELLLAAEAPADPGLAYYRELIWRNYDKILGDVYASSRAAIRSAEANPKASPEAGPVLWPRCVRAYATQCPRAAHDPNEFARAFPDWIAKQGALVGETLAARLAELADLHWTLHSCGIAPPLAAHPAEDLEQRIFIRQYSFDVVGWRKALEKGTKTGADLAALAPQAPVFLVLFRHLETHRVEILRASLADLQVISASAGVEAPPETRLSETLLAPARARLHALGILRSVDTSTSAFDA